MRSNEFISTAEAVAEATEFLSDTDFTHGIGQSFYEMLAHRAIEELALDTFFDQKTTDIFSWNACNEGIVDIPKNCFNIKELYLFNSECDHNRNVCSSPVITPSCCSECDGEQYGRRHWRNHINVFYARHYNRFGGSGIATKQREHLFRDWSWGFGMNGYEGRRDLIYYGIENGKICISEHGHHWKNMRIVSNTFGTDNCELPIIPRELRQAVVDYIKLKACTKLMVLFPEFKTMYQIYKLDLYGDGSLINPGSWLRATRFVISLNTKQRNDLQMYFGNIDLK